LRVRLCENWQAVSDKVYTLKSIHDMASAATVLRLWLPYTILTKLRNVWGISPLFQRSVGSHKVFFLFLKMSVKILHYILPRVNHILHKKFIIFKKRISPEGIMSHCDK
jgi:hypothetical protein